MDRTPLRWWSATAAVAALATLPAWRLLAHHAGETRRRLVKAELPVGWKSLPITATLTGQLRGIGSGSADEICSARGP